MISFIDFDAAIVSWTTGAAVSDILVHYTMTRLRYTNIYIYLYKFMYMMIRVDM